MRPFHAAMQHPRRDSVRNRAELLAAAERVIAEHGIRAHFNTIAIEAGVGRATLYRNFRDRDALLIALIDQSLTRFETFAASHKDEDALLHFLAFYVTHAKEHAALAAYAQAPDSDQDGLAAARRRFESCVTPMIARAISAGRCRPDLTLNDVRTLLLLLHATPRASDGEAAERIAERVMDLLFNGIGRR